MVKLLFNKDQNSIFIKLNEDNSEEIRIWRIINVIVPCIIILIPSGLFSFLPPDKLTFQDLILNGSFSLLGINILFSMSIFLINSIKIKDKKIEDQMISLRIRLIIYLCILLIFGTLIYVLQIAFNIVDLEQKTFLTIGFLMVLYFSTGIGKRIYLIKDELVGKSLGEGINDKVNELKNAVHDIE
jgi:hypothetical protein